MIDKFLESAAASRSRKTVIAYRDALRKVQNLLTVPLQEAPVDDLNAAFVKLDEQHSARTINQFKSAVRQYLKHAGRHEDACRIRNSRLDWLPREPPRAEELDGLLERSDPEERALILTLYSTGIRLRELLGNEFRGTEPIGVEDIDWAEGKIRVFGKGGREDYVVFLLRKRETLDALRRYLGSRKRGPLFNLTPSMAWRLVKRAGKRVGVNLYPHLFRHACATSMLRQGADIRRVQEQLRHRSLDLTSRYTRVTKGDLIRMADEREWR